MVYLFCGYRKWSLELYEKLSKTNYDFKLISSPKKLTYNIVKRLNPDLLFFPDWSWKVPNEIINNYQCICFHESDLPKFRGGSPLQNQIIRGIKKTKTTAFLMNEKIDGGDILLKKNLSLNGSLDEIFSRMIENDYQLIKKIINNNYSLKKQTGAPTFFKRRKPHESELKSVNITLTKLYDFIRMLDDPYPNAFIKIGKRKLFLKNPTLKNNKLTFNGELV